MGDWGIEVGDTLRFEYCKGPSTIMGECGTAKMVWEFTPREGVVEKVAGWGVVLQEQDPDNPGTTRPRSFSVFNAEKCRNLVRIPANAPMVGDGI